MTEFETLCKNVNESVNIDWAIEIIFKHYRKVGFPNYDIKNYDKRSELNKLIKYNELKLLDNKHIQKSNHGLGFLWTYFPHWVSVSCGNNKSLIESWNDDKTLKKLIRKTWNWQLKHGSGTFTENRIRQNSKVYCAKQSVSNFKPSVAKLIYNKYGNNGVTWDMSGGWGGRLFGFLASNCQKYIATEPSSKTFAGLVKLKEDYAYINKQIELHMVGSESFLPKKNSLDLCFTSPPYFNTEKYSDEDSQSYIKFPSLDEWLNGFINVTIKNCYYGLKKNGIMILNISDTNKIDGIVDKTLKVANDNGFILTDTLQMILSSIAGNGIKTEPIFIFHKRSLN